MYEVLTPKEPIIKTQRLVLHPLTVADAQAVFEWGSDPRVNKFMSYPAITDIEQEVQWLRTVETDQKEWNWGFVLKENGKLIGSGSIGPNAQMAEYWGMGYNIRYDCWGNGYTTEAMKAIIRFVHEELGVNKICSNHAVDNPASGRVMEKCGLQFHHMGEYSKIDGSETFKAKFYTIDF